MSFPRQPCSFNTNYRPLLGILPRSLEIKLRRFQKKSEKNNSYTLQNRFMIKYLEQTVKFSIFCESLIRNVLVLRKGEVNGKNFSPKTNLFVYVIRSDSYDGRRSWQRGNSRISCSSLLHQLAVIYFNIPGAFETQLDVSGTSIRRQSFHFILMRFGLGESRMWLP